MNPKTLEGIHDNLNTVGKTRFYWVMYKNIELPIKTCQEKCPEATFLRETGNTLFAIPNEFEETWDSATMLEKVKLKNFLGNQILYSHLNFSTWKYICWTKGMTQQVRTRSHVTQEAHLFTEQTFVRAWHCSMCFTNTTSFSIHNSSIRWGPLSPPFYRWGTEAQGV